MILVLAGTTEGSQVASLLKKYGWRVIASAVSSYGANLLSISSGGEVIEGELDQEQLSQLIKTRGVTVLVDATHPFAEQISRLAMQCAADLNIPYIRLERTDTPLPVHPLVHKLHQLEQLEEYLYPGQTVFSTLGSKHLIQVDTMIKRKKARLVARVLPQGKVIRVCEELGMNAEQIVALKGPFSKELNQQLFMHYSAELILTKDSGVIGGLDTKVEAALELNIPILVWKRPALNYPQVLHSAEDVVEYITTLNIDNIPGRFI